MDQESRDETSVRMSAVGPDGQKYAILSYSVSGGRGAAFILVPDRAPGWLRSVFRVANRGLRAVQPPVRRYESLALGVFEVLNSGGDLDQIHEVLVSDQAAAQKTAADLVRQIESGTLRPNEV